MKKLFIAAILFLSPLFIFSQDIVGLWQGTMYNDSTKTSLPYEIFIKKEKGKFTGYSYTWFDVNGEEYYGVKKVKVSVAKDGKIVIKDASLMENNYPVSPDKNVMQLNVLDLVSDGTENIMDGLFVTNLTKKYGEMTGHINVKRISTLTESSLMQYLQKKEPGIEVAAVK
ncbi:MAG: hypothetical protein HZB42_06065 [Sphingobacteriales bacterium]|nr:hypothetical protein [Sphingobacteriales bacterium]